MYRIAARVYPGRGRLRKAALRGELAGGKRGRSPLTDDEYAALLVRLQHDLAIDARLAHVEDLVGLLDRRVDRLLREIARRDPATQWEPPGAGEEGTP